MFKILYVVSTLKRTGPTNQLYYLAKNFVNQGFQVVIVTLSPEPADTRWDDFAGLGVVLVPLNMGRVAGIFLAQNALKRVVNDQNPDVIHSQGIRGDRLASRLDIGVGTLCTVRNFPQDDYRMTYGRLKAALMVPLHVRAMRSMRVCLGVSDSVSENLRSRFGLGNVDTIRNGVDTDYYFPVSRDRKAELREKLGLPQSTRVWISAGHLSDRKDPLFIIRQWRRLTDQGFSGHLVFVGDGDLMQSAKAQALGMGNVCFAGRVENVAEFCQAGDYLVSASKAEGLPNTVLEALACGLPVVLSDIAPHQEILELDSGVGRCFSLGDGESFLTCVTEMGAMDYQAASEAAVSLVENELSARVMAARYRAIYESLAEKQA